MIWQINNTDCGWRGAQLCGAQLRYDICRHPSNDSQYCKREDECPISLINGGINDNV